MQPNNIKINLPKNVSEILSRLENNRHEGYIVGEACAYTLDDHYFDTKERLWSQLIHYPEDSLTKIRKDLYKCIKNAYHGCLAVETGGRCG